MNSENPMLDEVFVRIRQTANKIELVTVTGSHPHNWELTSKNEINAIREGLREQPSGHAKNIYFIQQIITVSDPAFKFKEVVHQNEDIYKVVFDVHDCKR